MVSATSREPRGQDIPWLRRCESASVCQSKKSRAARMASKSPQFIVLIKNRHGDKSAHYKGACMKGSLKVMDRTGHTTVPFDTDTGDGLEEAIEKFNREVAHGAAAFDTSVKPGEPVRMGAYAPESMPDVTIVPAFQGG